MWEAIISGITLGCFLALSVGPVIFTVIKQSLTNGYVGGFSFVAGVWVSDILYVVICLWFSSVLNTLFEYKAVLGIVGGIFLVATGVFYLFFKRTRLQAEKEEIQKFSKRTIARIFSSGFLINTLNPSVFIFWLATATALSTQYTFEQRCLIFGICITFNIAADSLKVILSGRLRKKLTLSTISVVNKISGIILLGFGIALLIGTIFYKGEILSGH